MNVQKKIIVSILFSTLAIAACKQEPAEQVEQDKSAADILLKKETAKPDGEIIATVNGKNISMDSFQQLVQQKMLQNPAEPGDPTLILNEMINRELLLEAALAEGIDKKPEIKKQVEFSTSNILVNALVNEKVGQLDTSDTALKAEYDEQIKGIALNEYKARHILVNSEEDAAAVIKALSEGKDFVALAKEKSVGPSGPKGGDLGWFEARSMVPEFGDALKTMQKGEVSKTPVKTQFGWHIIKLEDSRDLEPPSFEESKAQIQTILANKAVQDYMKALRDKATIDIKQPEQKAVITEPAPQPATNEAATTTEKDEMPAEEPKTSDD